jgi:hypothetical protein
MTLFEFEKIYTREIEIHPDAIPCIEALFVTEKEQSFLVYREGGFYLVNKGPVLNLHAFSQWEFLHKLNSGNPFHLMKLYSNIDNAYMILENGIIKIGTAFSTYHGCPTENLWFASPSVHADAYAKWVEEIKGCSEDSIVDLRYL